jgi:hypothetical protein
MQSVSVDVGRRPAMPHSCAVNETKHPTHRCVRITFRDVGKDSGEERTYRCVVSQLVAAVMK